MKTDATLEVVAAYLRVNGYFVLTELEFHELRDGSYQTLTDVDVVAVRFPSHRGPVHYHHGDGAVECLLVGEVDPAFDVATDRVDVVIGEVKRGEASLNPALHNPAVLHAVLRRVGDVSSLPLDRIVDGLIRDGEVVTPTARFRIVAFGLRGRVAEASTFHHDHLVSWLNEVVGRHRDLYELTNFSDPILSVLALSARIRRPFSPVDVPDRREE